MNKVISGGRMKDYSGCTLVNPRPKPHHNARPPGKCRRHEVRKRYNYPMFFRRMVRNLLRDTLIHPEPDGA